MPIAPAKDAAGSTIVGPGGAGKTRLSVEVAARLVPRFEWGIRLCDLSPLRDPALVRSAVAQALGIRERAGRASSPPEVVTVASVPITARPCVGEERQVA